MKEIKLIHKRSNQVVGQRVAVANSFFHRFKGLMFQKSLGKYDGLLITKTKQIHMFWMRFPIDVLYVKRIESQKEGQFFEVVEVTEEMKPWTVGGWVRESTDVLELEVGVIRRLKIKKGDQLLAK